VEQPRLLAYLSLVSSFGTLLCCALPSLLVLLGLGATVAAFLSAAPWLVTLSHHKAWVFVGAGALIVANFVYVYRLAPHVRTQTISCPPGAELSACDTADRLSRGVLWISAIIYLVGVFTAYALGPLLVRFG